MLLLFSVSSYIISRMHFILLNHNQNISCKRAPPVTIRFCNLMFSSFLSLFLTFLFVLFLFFFLFLLVFAVVSLSVSFSSLFLFHQSKLDINDFSLSLYFSYGGNAKRNIEFRTSFHIGSVRL